MSNDQLIKIYNRHDPKTTEFEIRILFDHRIRRPRHIRATHDKVIENVKSIINQLCKVEGTLASIHQSINFITTKQLHNEIIQINFIRGVQDKKNRQFYSKRKLVDAVYLPGKVPYKIDISEELPISPFNSNTTDLVRMKLRASIISPLPLFKDWRIDITLVKNIPHDMQKIKKIKADLFTVSTIEELLQSTLWDYADVIEFEIEFTGKKINSDSLNVVDEIYKMMVTVEGYQGLINEMAKLLKPGRKSLSLKQLGNQVIDMTRQVYYNINDLTNYYITDKVDGLRTLIYVNSGVVNYINSAAISKPTKYNKTLLIDCEKYLDHYYIFDVMVIDDKNISAEPFSSRHKYFEKAVKILGSEFKLKKFTKLTKNYYKEIKRITESKKPYETDGYIFTPASDSYQKMKVLKWKPLDKLSIDFYVKKAPKLIMGISPFIKKPHHELYLLFVGISRKMFASLNLTYIRGYKNLFNSNYDYFPIQFSPSDEPYAYILHSKNKKLDNVIGEFSRINSTWKLLRIRTDRKIELDRGNYFGNDFRVAESIWEIYKNPLTLKDFEGKSIPDIYFKEDNNNDFKDIRNFNSYVKSNIFKQLSGDWALDIASGKGQDLFRYVTHVKHVMFLEKDKLALQELINRKHGLHKQNKRLGVHVLQMDMLTPYKENIKRLQATNMPVNGFKYVICNFAVHYFAASTSDIDNFINFVHGILAPGGRFIYTAFDGGAVNSLIKKTDWHVRIGETLQYSIKKEYSGKLTAAGQQISVMLPFSKGYYTEYLVNAEYWDKQFSRKKMTRELYHSFSKYLPRYSKTLNKNDIDFVSLYYVTSFYKK